MRFFASKTFGSVRKDSATSFSITISPVSTSSGLIVHQVGSPVKTDGHGVSPDAVIVT